LEPDVVAAPDEGVWRVGRDPDPLSASLSVGTSHLAEPHTGNRFDSPSGTYGVRYFATTLDGCFGETLARYRADKKLAKIIGSEWADMGFMNVGDIPADWRQRRVAVHVRFPKDELNRDVQFLDVESMQTREALLPDFEPLLALSRLNTDWECWAAFDRVPIEELTRRPILREDEALNRTATLYGLTIY